MVRSKSKFDTALIVFLTLIEIICIAPIINTVAISFSSQSKAAAGVVYFWPVDFTLASYGKILSDSGFFNSFLVSVERVLLGGGINMLLTIIMAYPLSKDHKAFKARNVYMWLIVFTMLFSGGLIPWYMTIRSLHIIDSIWALVLPCAVPVFNVILLMNFFRSVPKEIEEAAVIDGAGPWFTMAGIYVPVSLPAIATVTLFTVVNHWNSFFDGLVLINKPEHLPLQTYIQQLIVVLDIQNVTDPERLKEILKISNKTFNAAKIVVSMVPILLIYPFIQRYFITGITLGSLKE